MRKAFTSTLIELARQDPRVLLLTADLGYSVLEPFRTEFPTRFYNVGVAEQNMVGLATGLAKEGFVPFVYSMTTFAALRPYEFIRNGPVAHALMVRIVGVGGGFDYGTAGGTHHGLEDLAVLRAQPTLRIFSPADSAQARSLIQATWRLEGPVYYRLSKDEKPDIPGLNGRFDAGRVETLGDGKDVCLIATGRITEEAVAVAEELRTQHGISARVAVVSALNPAPVEDLKRCLEGIPLAVTVESHGVNGGLGSLVAEVIAENKLPCQLHRFGVRRGPQKEWGDGAFLQALHGISKNEMVLEIQRLRKNGTARP